jgi:hypothetical protein
MARYQKEWRKILLESEVHKRLLTHEEEEEEEEEEEKDGRPRIVQFDILTAITTKNTFFRDGSRVL